MSSAEEAQEVQSLFSLFSDLSPQIVRQVGISGGPAAASSSQLLSPMLGFQHSPLDASLIALQVYVAVGRDYTNAQGQLGRLAAAPSSSRDLMLLELVGNNHTEQQMVRATLKSPGCAISAAH